MRVAVVGAGVDRVVEGEGLIAVVVEERLVRRCRRSFRLLHRVVDGFYGDVYIAAENSFYQFSKQ